MTPAVHALRRLDRTFAELCRWPVRHRWLALSLALGLAALAAAFAAKMRVDTSLSELLPDDKPSVVEMRRTNARLLSQSTLSVAIQGERTQPITRLIDDVAPKIAALGGELVSQVDTGPRASRRFVEEHALLYMPLERLRELRDRARAAYDDEVFRRTGFALDLDEPPGSGRSTPDAAAAFDLSRLMEDELAARGDTASDYYIGEQGRLGVILVRTPLSSGSFQAFELQRRIRDILSSSPAFSRQLSFGFGGDLITSAEQHHAVVRDLTQVGLVGIGSIVLLVFLFFLRLPPLLAIVTCVAVGAAWSFAWARLVVGHLNSATGFLSSILVGNGINFGIIYAARFYELRRRSASLDEAVERAQSETAKTTLAASLAAFVAYGSLLSTDFRAFRHFGLIAGVGMLLCWLATYLCMPGLLGVLHRRSSSMADEKRSSRLAYGGPFAWTLLRAPRALRAVSVVSLLVGLILAGHFLLQGPFEKDLSRIGNEWRGQPSPARQWTLRVDRIVGRAGQDARAVLVDHLNQVKPLVAELERRRDVVPKDRRPFDRVVSIHTLLPTRQREKQVLLQELGELARRVERWLPDRVDTLRDARRRIERALRRPITIDDLPLEMAQPFVERDGRRGLVVYVVPAVGRSLNDAGYLMDLADSLRAIPVGGGRLIEGSGAPVLFADMLRNVEEDAPITLLVSLVGTMCVLHVALRRVRARWLMVAAPLTALVGVLAVLELAGTRLNFLNFVALPITLGVGADYLINVLRGVPSTEVDGDFRRDLHATIASTGGAVVLCSLTTTVGYFALLFSSNRAVKSFGLAAGIGEVIALLVALVFVPAWLVLVNRGIDLRAPSSYAREPVQQ